MEPTQEQIKQAQEAGNAVYEAVFEHARWNVASASEAYRQAYEAELSRLMSAEQLTQLADMADDIEESPKDWADMRGDTAL